MYTLLLWQVKVGLDMAQMGYFLKRLRQRARGGLPLFTELPTRCLLGN